MQAVQQIIHLPDVASQPWRNGGGQTRELLVWPAGASGDAWSLRISLADIESDGPFSAFPGITRWFTVVQGRGVVLRFGSHTITLAAGSDPLRFDGAAAPGCTLIDGPTRDLNLMFRGGEAVLLPARPGEPWTAGGFVQRGLFTTVPCTLRSEHGAPVLLPADALLWQGDAAAGELRFEPEPGPEPAAWWLGYSPGADSA